MVVQQMPCKWIQHLKLFWASLSSITVFRIWACYKKPRHWACEVLVLGVLLRGSHFLFTGQWEGILKGCQMYPRQNLYPLKHHESIYLKTHNKPKAAGQVLSRCFIKPLQICNRSKIYNLPHRTSTTKKRGGLHEWLAKTWRAVHQQSSREMWLALALR